jgi:hypothetical protein
MTGESTKVELSCRIATLQDNSSRLLLMTVVRTSSYCWQRQSWCCVRRRQRARQPLKHTSCLRRTYFLERERMQKADHWPRGLRCGSEAARFLVLWVRIPPFAWVSVSFECCVLSGRGLCVGLITRPESVLPNVVCLNECDRKASIKRRPWLTRGRTAHFQIVGLGSTSHGKYPTNIRFCLHFYRVKKDTEHHYLLNLLKNWCPLWSPKIMKDELDTADVSAINKVFPGSVIKGKVKAVPLQV